MASNWARWITSAGARHSLRKLERLLNGRKAGFLEQSIESSVRFHVQDINIFITHASLHACDRSGIGAALTQRRKGPEIDLLTGTLDGAGTHDDEGQPWHSHSYCDLLKLWQPQVFGFSNRIGTRLAFVCTTDSRHSHRVYPNLLAVRTVSGIDQVWAADLTYIRIVDGSVYLAVILDLFSRRVIGRAISRPINAELALTALRQAI